MMAVVFNADEVLQIAERIEHNGASFYRRAAELLTEARVNKMLLELACLEDAHEQTFAQMRAQGQLSEAQRQPTTFDPEGESQAYLQALADRRLFDVTADPADRLTGKQTAEDVLIMAIGLEKDSIVFYLGLKDFVPAKLGADKIDAIIKEEMRHVTILSRELAALG